MTREEAIQMIQNDMRLHHDYLSGDYRKALRLAIEALQQPEQRWIPCEKRMPETDDEVLITVLDMEDDYVEVYKGFYQDHEWWTQWCHGCLKIKDEPCGVNIVTAWMPLPDPYREEGETDG